MIYKRFFTILLLIPLLVGFSCVSPPLPKCYNELTKDIRIRWGSFDSLTKEIHGFQITADSRLYEIHRDSTANAIEEKELAYVDSEKFCRIFAIIKDSIVSTQALHAPGRDSRFVEYLHPEMHYSYRAVWNNKFQTYGSRGFREIYDSLEAMLPIEIKSKVD